ncbi:uncharacterized protein LOC134225322 [Armigeres subalbatus]|uniref:uncharacterized protein LOC134225322 n=1 Tax=Armigeres subalbatus TaxID=124917 RepID=UPI002ED5BC5A
MVMLSYIAIFFELDLDFLCAVRTPPNFSFINPAEQFMAAANIALIGVSLSRNHLGENEKLVKNLMSKKQWREAHEKNPNNDYPRLALEGTEDARRLLKSRFESLRYKGEKVIVSYAANEAEINTIKANITDQWPEINLSKISKAEAMNVPSFKEFFDKHVKATSYTFQVKKCNDINCKFHKAKRMDQTINIPWLPKPQLKGEKYEEFDEVYGTEPNDDCQPSKIKAMHSQEERLPHPSFALASTRARIIITCTECKFPRPLYSQYSMNKQQLMETERFFDKNVYICGVPLEGLPDVFQNPKIKCFDPIHLHYFQCSSLKGFKNLCAKCLVSNSSVTHNKLNICGSCYASVLKNINLKQRNVKAKTK